MVKILCAEISSLNIGSFITIDSPNSTSDRGFPSLEQYSPRSSSGTPWFSSEDAEPWADEWFEFAEQSIAEMRQSIQDTPETFELDAAVHETLQRIYERRAQEDANLSTSEESF